MRKVFAESMTKGKYLTMYGYRSIRKTLTSCRTVDKEREQRVHNRIDANSK